MATPSKATKENLDKLLEIISSGKSMVNACKEIGVHYNTALRWLEEDKEGIQGRYAHAKEQSAEVYADEIVSLTEQEPERDLNGEVSNSWIQLQKLRIDSRKWAASKLKPKKYGDRIHTEVSGKLSLEQLLAQASDAPPEQE